MGKFTETLSALLIQLLVLVPGMAILAGIAVLGVESLTGDFILAVKIVMPIIFILFAIISFSMYYAAMSGKSSNINSSMSPNQGTLNQITSDESPKSSQLIKENSARYFGGHSDYQLEPGSIIDKEGTVRKGFNGVLQLYEEKIVFERHALKKENKWVIVIPIDKIDLKNITSKKESWYWTSLRSRFYMTKKLLKIPYTDENGIKQAPRFEIKDIMMRDITEEWADEIIEAYKIMIIKKVKENK